MQTTTRTAPALYIDIDMAGMADAEITEALNRTRAKAADCVPMMGQIGRVMHPGVYQTHKQIGTWGFR